MEKHEKSIFRNSVRAITSHDIFARAVSDSYVIKAKTNFSRESFKRLDFVAYLISIYLFISWLFRTVLSRLSEKNTLTLQLLLTKKNYRRS